MPFLLFQQVVNAQRTARQVGLDVLVREGDYPAQLFPVGRGSLRNLLSQCLDPGVGNVVDVACGKVVRYLLGGRLERGVVGFAELDESALPARVRKRRHRLLRPADEHLAFLAIRREHQTGEPRAISDRAIDLGHAENKEVLAVLCILGLLFRLAAQPKSSIPKFADRGLPAESKRESARMPFLRFSVSTSKYFTWTPETRLFLAPRKRCL